MNFALKTLAALLIPVSVFAHGGHDHGDIGKIENSQSNHLSFPLGQVHAHTQWLNPLAVGTPNTLRIEWRAAADHVLVHPPANFEVVLWMPSMGHGSAPTKIQQTVNTNGEIILGTYDVSNVHFIMGGDWDVNVSLVYPDGQKETQTIKLLFPLDGGHKH